jgi:hypothetical protein
MEEGGRVSDLYAKHFLNGHVRHLGSAKRGCNYRDREIVNSSFVSFCELKSMSLPSDFRMAVGNPAAGYLSCAKYDKDQPQLDEAAWLLSGEWTKQHFFQAMSGSEILSTEDVVVELEKTTSPGYPWNTTFTSKSGFLTNVDAVKVLGDFWDELANDDVEKRPIPIWACSQKIELRDVDKLIQNRLRTFTASPIEHSVALNRLCLDQNTGFYGAHGSIWSAVGMSKYLSGWDLLYRRLNKHPNAFELDESEFDSSLFRAAMYGQRDIRWSFLKDCEKTELNRRRLATLYDHIVNSVMIMDSGELLMKDTGNPSGSSNTVVDNTMILFRLFAYAWIVLCNELGRIPKYEEFVAEVEAALYGDDNTYTCSDEVVGWFHPTNIARIWSGIGVTTKTPCWEPRELKDCAFLSTKFYFSESLNMWFPYPESNRVLASLCYGSKIDDVRWHYLRACALRMDSFWNLETRSILSDYLSYLNKMFPEQLCGEVNGIDFSMIKNMWRSDAWLEALYAGYEKVGFVIRSDLNFLYAFTSFPFAQLVFGLDYLSCLDPPLKKLLAVAAD